MSPWGFVAKEVAGLYRAPLGWAPLLVAYVCVGAVPYLFGLTSANVAYRNAFTEIVTLASMVGMMLLLVQFALSGRIGAVVRWTGADHGARLHRKMGEMIALVFLLHPFLIVLPRAWVSGRYAPEDLWESFTAPLTDTGFYAWSLLITWVLMAMFKDRLNLSYEAWRISHGVGAAAIAILATLHVITIGRHGAYPSDEWLDAVWISLCALAVVALLYTYLVRPWLIARRGFVITSIERVSRSDWSLTLQQRKGEPLRFDAGQFVWLNTGASPHARLEHPFSIASASAAWPNISFIVRELGDYTQRLGSLRVGQCVYVEGPQGEFTLNMSHAKGIALIATGAGIAPVIGLLRELRDRRDPRPIRLVYGNRTLDQMVFQAEILSLQEVLNFEQVLVVSQAPPKFVGHSGRVDAELLRRVFDTPDRLQWNYYVCGSSAAVESIVASLREVGIPKTRIINERLAF